MDALIHAARSAVKQAYVPYSGYAVGAALRTTSGEVYSGANVEVGNYTNTMHAETIAIGGAVLEGHGSFDAIAVSSADRDGVTPCGLCRQTLFEFCDESLRIVCDEGEDVATYTLGSLLPHAFHASGLTDE